MSFKIIKRKKVQDWVDETAVLIKNTLEGEYIPIELRKLPQLLQQKIKVNARIVTRDENIHASKPPMNKDLVRLHQLLGENSLPLPSEQAFNLINVSDLATNEKIKYEYSWTAKAPLPDTLKTYLLFALKLLSIFPKESENKPVDIEDRFNGSWVGTGWAFKGYIYEIIYKYQLPYSKEEEELLILEHHGNEQENFKNLKRKYKSGNVETESYKRERISEEVRIAVWRRDDGQCARCGSRENLEYDHIVPVSKGGGNTARNIELLCESCNRKKSNKIE